MPEITFGPRFPKTQASGPGSNIDLTRGTGYCRCDSPDCDAMIHMDRGEGSAPEPDA